MMPGTIASARCIFGPLPLAAMPRTGTGVERHWFGGMVGPVTVSHGPTSHAYKYVGNGLVRAKVIVFQPAPAGLSLVSAAFATALSASGMVSDKSSGALKPGSSKHGNARRALIGSICVCRYASPANTTL